MSSIVDEPFHEGERAVQERIGVRERLAQVGPLLMRARLTEEQRAFFPLLDFVVVGVVDDDGRPRATLVDGGARSPTPTTLAVGLPSSADPARARITSGAPIAILGLQPHTRRRNRVNGVVGSIDERGFVVDVKQAFGNCPKFIRVRTTTIEANHKKAKATTSTTLSAADRACLRACDTFFIASAHATAGDDVAAHGVDVSHRGGKAGFFDVDVDGVLWVPDYQGNFYFNTLGNLVVQPRAGLVLFDDRGGLLQLAVDVEVIWDGSIVDAVAGAQRLLKMRVTEVVRIEHALAVRFTDAGA